MRLLESWVFRNIVVNLVVDCLSLPLFFGLSTYDICCAVAVSWRVGFHFLRLGSIDISMVNVVSDELWDRWWNKLNGLELVSWVEGVARLSGGFELAEVWLGSRNVSGAQLIVASIQTNMQVSRLTAMNINIR